MNTIISWHAKTFDELTNNELYDCLKLRIDIFVVEQTCYYPDLDDLDRHPATIHLFHYHQDKIASYARILPKGLSYPDYVSIGRVIIAPHARGTGVGHALIAKAVEVTVLKFPDIAIKISAQEHLEKYYQQHGFKRVSDMYLEDGIPHIGMLRKAKVEG